MKDPKIKITVKEGDEPATVEIMERAIIDLAAGMRRFNQSRLKREAIVLLLYDASRVGKSDIRTILSCMDRLEDLFLKPRKS